MKNWIMPNKILAFDGETTGIGKEFGLIEWAAIAFVNGKEVGEINLRIKPFESDLIDKNAMLVHGLDLTEGLEPLEAHKQIVNFLGRFVDKFDKNDKFTPLAMNGTFDIDHTNFFFQKCGDKYFGSWQNFNLLDPLPFFRVLRFLKKLDLPDMKLGTLAEHYKIEIKAHQALSDIRATLKLFKPILKHMLKYEV